MARDTKVNYNQKTLGQLRRMCDTLLSLGNDQQVVTIPERALKEASPVSGDAGIDGGGGGGGGGGGSDGGSLGADGVEAMDTGGGKKGRLKLLRKKPPSLKRRANVEKTRSSLLDTFFVGLSILRSNIHGVAILLYALSSLLLCTSYVFFLFPIGTFSFYFTIFCRRGQAIYRFQGLYRATVVLER